MKALAPAVPEDYLKSVKALEQAGSRSEAEKALRHMAVLRPGMALAEAAGRPDFLVVTPGVRPAGSDAGDQKRIATPAAAAAQGASHLVIGRPVGAAPDPAAAQA